MTAPRLTLTVSRMEGTSNAKCRLWRLRLFVGGKPAKSKRFHGTYSQAKVAGEEFRAEYAEQLALTGYDPDMTFAAYAELWQRRREASGDFERQTLLRSQGIMERLCRVIGNEKVSALTRPKLIDALSRIKAGEVGGKQLMNSTMIGYHSTLKMIMEEAERDELIARSPMRTIKQPKSDAKPKQALPYEDYMRVVEGLTSEHGSGSAVGMALIALNGLRRSEVVALDWGNDLGDGLAVLGSIETATGTRKGTKTKSGERVIPMTAKTRELLDGWKAEQAEMLAALGIEQTDETPMLTTRSGTRLRGSTLYSWWRDTGCPRYGVDCSVHELRHTFLTYLAQSQDAFALKRIAGWSRIAMADTYVHADDAADREAMKAFEQRAQRYTGGTKATQRKATQGNAEQREGRR